MNDLMWFVTWYWCQNLMLIISRGVSVSVWCECQVIRGVLYDVNSVTWCDWYHVNDFTWCEWARVIIFVSFDSLSVICRDLTGYMESYILFEKLCYVIVDRECKGCHEVWYCDKCRWSLFDNNRLMTKLPYTLRITGVISLKWRRSHLISCFLTWLRTVTSSFHQTLIIMHHKV